MKEEIFPQENLEIEEEKAENKASSKDSAVKEPSVSSEKEDYKDKYFRLLAETENARKRMQKEKHEAISFAIENTICEFLSAIDNFENALKFAQNSTDEVKNWAMGFSMIQSQLRDVLYNHGVVPFHSVGNLFDHNFHEAMEMVETTNSPDGTILEEYAKGYKSSLRTIRPAKVKVAKSPSKTEEKQNEAEADKNLNQTKNEVIHE
jgi:molecular chaperone GrpE